MRLIDRTSYIHRARELLGSFPVVAVMGPRQCGKTTIAKTGFPEYEYLDLELPSDFQKFEADPELFLRTRQRPLIVDEAQRAPALFPILRALVDADRKRKGQYLLLGSASFSLQKRLSESLSGRIGFLDLSPLLLPEITARCGFDTHWLKGGYPDALLEGTADSLNFDWFEAYTRTLIERDLPALGIDVNAILFRRLWAMCSHFHANILNMNKIASSLGISPHSVRRYIDILEQTFVLRRLAPYHANIKKRLIKSPKLFFRDAGLYHYFSRILDHEALLTSPNRGSSFEGYVVEQILQMLRVSGSGWEPFFFRTSDGMEADLLLVRGESIIVVEIKCALSSGQRERKTLQKTISLLGAEKAYVITLGQDRFPISDRVTALGIHQWIREGTPPFW